VLEHEAVDEHVSAADAPENDELDRAVEEGGRAERQLATPGEDQAEHVVVREVEAAEAESERAADREAEGDRPSRGDAESTRRPRLPDSGDASIPSP
jgi:hypothetical protein